MSDEGVQRLARLEGQMESVFQSVQRIEQVIQKVVGPIDRSLGEMTINMRHLGEKLQETREATAACNESHRASTELMKERVDGVHDQTCKLENKATAGLRVAVWFCGIFSAVAFGSGGWIFAQVGKNTEINAVQQQRIEQLEKQVSDIRTDERNQSRK